MLSTSFPLVSVTLSVAGCSLSLDLDPKQCSQDSQCVRPYTCNVKTGLCVQPPCDDDNDCQGGICERQLCTPPQCREESDCDDGLSCDATALRFEMVAR